MGDKPYRDMSDDELREAHLDWSARVGGAAGWASAYFAAQQLEAICKEGDRRSMSPHESVSDRSRVNRP